MIPFFRRIRRKLANDNQFLKYSRYAIGEIVLVVVGILIALQINNWNEIRKTSKLEQSYYCLLLDDLEQDKEQITTLKNLNEKRIESSNKAISIIQSDKVNPTKLGIEIVLSRRDGGQIFHPNSSTYEDIKSSGNIGTLKDNQIRKSLSQYIKRVEGYNSTILSNQGIVVNRITNTADWFNNGTIHASKRLFPKEIQHNLSIDLPDNIPDETKSRLYEDLVVAGALLKRRSELLNLIENEVDIMKLKLTNKCK